MATTADYAKKPDFQAEVVDAPPPGNAAQMYQTPPSFEQTLATADPNVKAEDRIPSLPYTMEDGTPANVPMDRARDFSNQQDITHILNSPLSEAAKLAAIQGITGISVKTSGPVVAASSGDAMVNALSGPTDLQTGEHINQFAQQNYDAATANNASVANQAARNAHDEQKLATAEAAQRAPLDEAAAQFASGQLQSLQALDIAQQQKTQAAMARYHQTNEEMHALAVQRPKDLFGAAGINGIMGRVALFLGGAGTNGAHENRNLAFIQDLANRNIAQQERNWNHLQAVGRSDETLYGQIRTQTQDAHAAAAVMHNMYLSAYQAQLQSMSNVYAGQRTQVAMNKELTKIAAARGANDNAYGQQLIETATKTLQVSGQQQAQSMALALKLGQAQQKQDRYVQENTLPGWNGTVNPKNYAKLSEFQSSGKNIIDNLQEIELLANDSGDPLARAKAIDLLQTLTTQISRKFFDTGARLEGPEIQAMQKISTSGFGALLKMLQGDSMDAAEFNSTINVAREAIRRSIYTKIKYSAKNVEPDTKDELWSGFDAKAHVNVADRNNGKYSKAATQVLDSIKRGETPGAGYGSD